MKQAGIFWKISLMLVVVLIFSSGGVCEADDWSAWQYLSIITIDNSAGPDALTDYQVAVNLDSANFDFTKALVDGADVRFADNMDAALNFWVEQWDSTPGSEGAKIHVKVPAIPGSGTATVYMYYGNPSAGSASSGPNTFMFFDDFTSATLTMGNHPLGWGKIAYESIPEIQDESFELVMKMETRGGHGGTTYSELGYYLYDVSSNDYFQSLYYVTSNAYAGCMWLEGGSTQAGMWSKTTYYDNYQFYTLKIRYLKNTSFQQLTLHTDGTARVDMTLAPAAGIDFYPDQFRLYARNDFNTGGYIAYDPTNDLYKISGRAYGTPVEEWIHRVLIRKLASSEPAVTVTTAEDADDDGYYSDVDCDDNDSSVYPGAPELCDGKDNNCDDVVPADEVDVDGDGFMICAGDCDDLDSGINPDAYELPGNVVDENCDGSLGACDPGAVWKNHGQFVRCVAHETDDLIDAGVLTQDEGDALISSAAQSDIGKK